MNTSPRIPTFKTGVIRPVECVREGRVLIGDRYWVLVGINFVGLLLAGSAPLYILYGPMMCGIAYCFLALKRGEPFEFSDLFKGFGFFGPAFLAGLIQMLPIFILSMVAYLPLFLLFTVYRPERGGRPDEMFGYLYGGFWLVMLLVVFVSSITHLICIFSFPLVVEWKLNGWEAIKVSAQAVRGNLGGAVGLTLLCGLMFLGGMMVCGIGIYFVMPLIHAAWTVAYRRVFPEYPHHLETPPDPPKWQEWRPEGGV
ncbi:MAG: hypothetical protein ABIP75_05330 [Pyrinomonadaceae bacterium]